MWGILDGLRVEAHGEVLHCLQDLNTLHYTVTTYLLEFNTTRNLTQPFFCYTTNTLHGTTRQDDRHDTTVPYIRAHVHVPKAPLPILILTLFKMPVVPPFDTFVASKVCVSSLQLKLRLKLILPYVLSSDA